MKSTGLLSIILSAILYGIIPLFTKNSSIDGLPVLCATFYRMFMIVAITGTVLIAQHASFKIDRKCFVELVFMSVCGLGITNFLLVTSYQYIPMGMATMLHFSYPVITAVIMHLLFRETTNCLQNIAVVVALSAIMWMLVRCDNLSVAGIAIAVGSGCTYSIYTVMNEKGVKAPKLSRMLLAFYVNLFGGVFFLSVAMGTGVFKLPTIRELGFLGISAPLSLIAMVLYCYGVKILGATKGSFISMLEPITCMMIDFLVYGTRPDTDNLFGCMMMLVAVGMVSASMMRKKSIFQF